MTPTKASRTVRNPAPYPAKKPDARIAGAVISATVFQQAMLSLQKTRKVDGVTQYYFARADVNTAAKKATGQVKLAINNMQRFFKKNDVPTVSRDKMMQFIQGEANAELLARAGKDGKFTPKEAAKLARWVRDDYKFITTGKLPK